MHYGHFNNGLEFSQYCGSLCGGHSISIIYLNSSINVNQNLSIDVNERPFYGFYGDGCQYCGPNYWSWGGVLGFYSISNGLINSIDIGSINDQATGGLYYYSIEQLYLNSNNGIAINSNVIFNNSDQPYGTYGPLPLSITLKGNKIYAQSNYSDTTNQIYNESTNQWFSGNDLFAIQSSIYTFYYVRNSTNLIQWFRIRNPPPNDIFPTENTV